MSATEKLRRLLDERGTEYYPKHADETVWTASSNAHVWACNDLIDGYLEIHMRPITPEQAIEATLGGGTLTADDVRDLIERHSDASGGNGRDFHNSAYVAIADELNATLGSAENAKLRELVRDMWRTFMGGKTTAAQRAELRERMRELGVDA